MDSRDRRATAIVAVLVLAAYARALFGGFTYDEGLVIVQAQHFLRSGDVGALFSKRYFAATLEGTWRPLCTFTYMIDAAFGVRPLIFKLDSVAWHVGAALLVTALARRLLPQRHRGLAVVAGLLFGLHPVATEAVDNASFREDALATFFVLGALILALDGRRFSALLAYTLALLSKESAVVAPALLLGARLVRPDEARPAPGARGYARGLAAELAPYAAVAAVYLAIRFGPMRTPVAYAHYPGGSFGAALLGTAAIWVHDLRLFVVPSPLCADYGGYFGFGRQAVRLAPCGASVALVYAAAVTMAAARGHRLLALGLGWVAVALLPVANLIPIPVPAAERFLYLPLAGVALTAAAAAGWLRERLPARARPPVAAAGLAVLALFAVLTDRRHRVWRDDATLWAATVQVNPRSCGAQSAIGGRLLRRGLDSGDVVALREAAGREELALALCPSPDGPSERQASAMVYTRLGAARALLGEVEAARAALERAGELAPRDALAAVWLGYAHFLRGDKGKAAALLLRSVVELGPPDEAVAEVAARYIGAL